jgi:hypothetical protein
MLQHSLIFERARALPVGALATYALRILNTTALTRSTVSCRCPSAPIVLPISISDSLGSLFSNALSARYLSTLLGLKSEF